MPIACDFHTHSLYSDGTLTPAQLVQAAHEAGITVLSLTDHDITDGIEEAQAEGRRLNVDVIPGIELSATAVNAKGVETEMHILGYFIQHQDSQFQQTLAMFRQARLNRAEQMVARLAQIGVNLDMKKIRSFADGKSVGRPHIARALVQAGYVSSTEEAFSRYLKDGRPGYVPKARLTPVECIQMIRRVGGLAVLAHPYYGAPRHRRGWDILVKAGLNGIEAFHSQHAPKQSREYEKLAKELDLLVTGGSDFHSFENPQSRLGQVLLPHKLLEAMLQKKRDLDAENQSIF